MPTYLWFSGFAVQACNLQPGQPSQTRAADQQEEGHRGQGSSHGEVDTIEQGHETVGEYIHAPHSHRGTGSAKTQTQPVETRDGWCIRDRTCSRGTVATMAADRKTTQKRMIARNGGHLMLARAVSAAFLIVLTGVGLYANALRVVGQPWPQWMDGRYGGPLPWVMFADGIDCSVEVVGIVDSGGRTTEVGRGSGYPGPGEWFWTVDDSWHQYAWFSAETIDWDQVENYAREAAGVDTGDVVFVLRERRSSSDGSVRVRDLAPESWGEACGR